jgi:hypothetical protein
MRAAFIVAGVVAIVVTGDVHRRGHVAHLPWWGRGLIAVVLVVVVTTWVLEQVEGHRLRRERWSKERW